MRKKAVQQGRSERRGESYSVPYVEPLRDARTPLAAFFRILLQYIAPWRTDGKRGVDQAYVRISLREVPELDASFRHKVLSNEPEAVGTRENLIHDLLRLGVTAEFCQRLNDPK